MQNSKLILLLLTTLFCAITTIIFSPIKPLSIESTDLGNYLPKTNPTATPYAFPYKNPTIAKNDSYRTVLVGDSMTETLGVNVNTLRLALISLYPENEFVNYNYGYGATNVLSLVNRLTRYTTYNSKDNLPILDVEFEFIIIESFGYNPLSEYPLDQGLALQTQELDKAVNLILNSKPNVALAFMTPIAPSEENFARNSRELSDELRKQWVAERVAYINNHRKFAQEKGIPVIDVYQASLGPNGKVDERYIATDYIHPSTEGIELVSSTIADYIYQNRIFPE